MCAISWGELLKSNINGEHLSYHDTKPCLFFKHMPVLWGVFVLLLFFFGVDIYLVLYGLDVQH